MQFCQSRLHDWLIFALLVGFGAGGYIYPSYATLVSEIKAIPERFPGCATVYNALDRWPNLANFSDEVLLCGESRTCEFLVIEVGNISSPNQVFLSGALHGDERVGPLAVFETVKLLCELPEAVSLSDRLLVAFPMTNPYGYAHNVREENGRDPNRDFPYDQSPDQCFLTVTARVVSRIFTAYSRIQTGVTFHAGEQSITYPWGSFNHKNDIAPDTVAMSAVAAELQRQGGGPDVYRIGSMGDVVYPVHGGMEDWAYAQGIEPPMTCTPKSFGGLVLPQEDVHNKSSASIFLVETTNIKSPPEADLGIREDVWVGGRPGPVPRCIRFALAVLALVKPTVIVLPMIVDNAILVHAEGCLEVVADGSLECRGTDGKLEMFVFPTTGQSCRAMIKLPMDDSFAGYAGECTVNLQFEFDQTAFGSTTNNKLEYTSNRSIVVQVPMRKDIGMCGTIGDLGLHACVSTDTLFVHPRFLHHKPTVTLQHPDDGDVTPEKVSGPLTRMFNPIDITEQMDFRLSSTTVKNYVVKIQLERSFSSIPEQSLASDKTQTREGSYVSNIALVVVFALPAAFFIIYFIKIYRYSGYTYISPHRSQFSSSSV